MPTKYMHPFKCTLVHLFHPSPFNSATESKEQSSMKSCSSVVLTHTYPTLLSSSSSPILSTSHRFPIIHKPHQTIPHFVTPQLSYNCNYAPHHHLFSPLYATATAEIAEIHESSSEFIEVGYVYSIHGLQGHVRIKSGTDFPELRFSEPGKRWLRQEVSGREVVQEMELVEGRGQPGQKGWIVKFNGIDTVEEAQRLIGSTVLVVDDDRPALEEGEFYTRDLVGMRVNLKETGEPVGIVVNVFDSGANDLLHVRLDCSVDISHEDGNLKLGLNKSGPLVYIPFVEAIVPDVDLNKREMLITPPNGLLELNIRSDERSKKERRQLEWKERKKFQKRLIAAKKKLCEMEQQHVFHGFRCGQKDQRSSLASQIVSVNSQLLQQAMLSTQTQPKRLDLGELISSLHTKNNVIKDFSSDGTGEDAYLEYKSRGDSLAYSGKLACVLASEDWSKFSRRNPHNEHDREVDEEYSCLLLKTLLNEESEFIKIDQRPSVPLILVFPANSIGTLQQLFIDHDYFSFNSEKVWFLEEETLPVISNNTGDKSKILMKSPWEIYQKSIGSAGVLSRLSSLNLFDDLGQMGVEYIEVRSIHQRCHTRQTLLGLVNSHDSHVGLQVLKHDGIVEEGHELIFSIAFMNQLSKQMNQLQFEAISRRNAHIEKADNDWVHVVPSSPNSLEFCCSLFRCLGTCPPDKISILEVLQ